MFLARRKAIHRQSVISVCYPVNCCQTMNRNLFPFSFPLLAPVPGWASSVTSRQTSEKENGRRKAGPCFYSRGPQGAPGVRDDEGTQGIPHCCAVTKKGEKRHRVTYFAFLSTYCLPLYFSDTSKGRPVYPSFFRI